jgi:dTDP-4-dehydrorhamnose reductase
LKTLVLGGAGMLGHKIVQTYLSASLPITCTVRSADIHPVLEGAEVITNVDVTDQMGLRQLLESEKPEVTINCIGVIKQRDEAKSAIPSITINALLPHLLADWAQSWNGRVIHFSTDCIFSGKKGNYCIDDPSDAEDLYGKSKFLGEVSRTNAATLRTSIIGRELSHFGSLVEWFYAQDGKHVKGYRRAIYSGMTTQTMARLVLEIATKHPNLHGLHHAVSEKVNKFDLVTMIRDKAELDIEVEPYDDFFCDRSMLASGLEKGVGFRVPSWEEQLDELVNDPTPYGEWR